MPTNSDFIQHRNRLVNWPIILGQPDGFGINVSRIVQPLINNISITGIDFSRDLTLLKKTTEFQWLKDTPAAVLQQSLRDQDRAFSNFFAKRAKYPKYKSKQNAQSIRFQLDQRTVGNNYRSGKLLKLTGLEELDITWSRLPVGIPKMVTVSKDAANRYFVSFSCEEEIQHLPETHKGIGIDLGIKDILVSSDGYKSGNPRHLNKKLQRLKHYQRLLSRCQKGSHRRKKALYKVAKCHAKIKDARKDWINVRFVLRQKCLIKQAHNLGW